MLHNLFQYFFQLYVIIWNSPAWTGHQIFTVSNILKQIKFTTFSHSTVPSIRRCSRSRKEAGKLPFKQLRERERAKKSSFSTQISHCFPRCSSQQCHPRFSSSQVITAPNSYHSTWGHIRFSLSYSTFFSTMFFFTSWSFYTKKKPSIICNFIFYFRWIFHVCWLCENISSTHTEVKADETMGSLFGGRDLDFNSVVGPCATAPAVLVFYWWSEMKSLIFWGEGGGGELK